MRVRNLQTSIDMGNDFAIDDISFTGACSANSNYLSGSVYSDTAKLLKGRAILFDLSTNLEEPLQTYVVDGYYSFYDIKLGKYKIFIIPESLDTLHYFPTYFHNHLHAKDANSVHVFGDAFKVDIQLEKKPSFNKGEGIIEGTINTHAEQTENKGMAVENLSIPNVILLLNEFKQPIDWTITDSNGKFRFDSLAYGKYSIQLEKLGYSLEGQEYFSVTPDTKFLSETYEMQHSITSVRESLKNEMVKIYPNPVQDEIIVQNISKSNIKSIELLSAVGQQIFSSENLSVAQQQIIPAKDLPQGVYILKVADNFGAIYNHQLVK